MANQKLQGLNWKMPEKLSDHLRRTMNSYKGDKTMDGYKRLQNLIDEPNVSYEGLKRIKNFFDTHKTANVDYMDDKKQDTEFILNGGSKMRHWVNDTLNRARQGVEAPKKAKHAIGMLNQYQKDDIRHTKDGVSTDNLKIKEGNTDIYFKKESVLMESLISIFDKNKKICQTDNKYLQS